MNLSNILIVICSLLFFMIGADKFLGFLEPPCTLMDNIPSTAWMFLGVMQIAAGILIWIPKYRKYVVGFFAVFMVVFVIVHLTQGTSDIGGAAAMAAQLSILVWNPAFIHKKFFGNRN